MVIFEKRVDGLSETALARFVLRAKTAAKVRGKVNVLITNNAALRSLNSRFRGKSKPTDVLSFPSEVFRDVPSRATGGEIAISADIALQNAVRLGHSVAQEIKILTLHGILHLAGHDHERDNGSMARKESRLRLALHLPDGLIERTAHPARTKLGSSARAKGPRRR